MLGVYDYTSKIFAESQEEVDQFTAELMSFIREQRAEGRPVTATKLTTALINWKSNPIVKNHINNHFKI